MGERKMIGSILSVVIIVIAAGVVGRHSLKISSTWMTPVAMGALLAVVVTHLLPESYEGLGLLTLPFLVGIPAVLVLLDRYAHAKVSAGAQLLADIVHGLGDGATIAAGWLGGLAAGLVTSASVLVHELAKTPAEVAAYKLGGSRNANQKNVLGYTGMVIGVLIPSSHAMAELPALTATSAGVLCYVIAFRLFPELRGAGKVGLRHFLLLLLGFAVVALTGAIGHYE